MDNDHRDETVRQYLEVCEIPEHEPEFFSRLAKRLEETHDVGADAGVRSRAMRNQRSTWLSVVSVAVALVAVGTAYAESRPGHKTIYVPAGQSLDLTSTEFSPGDVVKCAGTSASAVIPQPGHGVGSSAGLTLATSADGKTVHVDCAPVNNGNA